MVSSVVRGSVGSPGVSAAPLLAGGSRVGLPSSGGALDRPSVSHLRARTFPRLKAAAVFLAASSLIYVGVLAVARLIPAFAAAVGVVIPATQFISTASVLIALLVFGVGRTAYRVWDWWSAADRGDASRGGEIPEEGGGPGQSRDLERGVSQQGTSSSVDARGGDCSGPVRETAVSAAVPIPPPPPPVRTSSNRDLRRTLDGGVSPEIRRIPREGGIVRGGSADSFDAASNISFEQELRQVVGKRGTGV